MTKGFFRSALAALFVVSAAQSAASDSKLPSRTTAIPQTTNGVPHVQIGVRAAPELSKALLQRVGILPGVRLGPTQVSLPGAVGFQLSEGVALAHPEVIVGGREFAHIHPDGSLHASLSPELASEAVKKGWAVAHPWANQRDGWEGFVLIYTPTSKDELDVVFHLVEQSYAFVTGTTVNE